MISRDLKSNLDIIQKQIDECINLSRDEIFTAAVDSKLQKSLLRYYNEIRWNSDNILDLKDPRRILKTITRQQRQDDKEVILAKTKKENKKKEE